MARPLSLVCKLLAAVIAVGVLAVVTWVWRSGHDARDGDAARIADQPPMTDSNRTSQADDATGADRPAKTSHPTLFVPRPTTLAPGIHLLGELAPSVAYVVETSDGLILIDTGVESDCQILLRQLEELELDVNRLKMILITHSHGDHYLGAMHLRELTGAKIYAGQNDAEIMRVGGPRDAVFSTFDMDGVEILPTIADVELSGGESLELGSTRIQVLATPGHTPGSLCYLLRRDGRTALFSGDTIMSITGDLGTYSAYLPPKYRGDARAHLASFQTLAELGVPDLLLPGHPYTRASSVNASLSPQQWQQLLDRGMNDMHELLKRYESDGEDFLDGTPKQLLEDVFYLGDHQGSAVYCMATSGRTRLVICTSGARAGFPEFLQQALTQFQLDASAVHAVLMPACDAASVQGLTRMPSLSEMRIAVPRTRVDQVRQIVKQASVVAAETESGDDEQLSVKTFALNGLLHPRVAFLVRHSGKRILLTADMPFSAAGLPDRGTQRVVNPTSFLLSFRALEACNPDLWLPSTPRNGQNANLYGNDWRTTVQATLHFILGQ